MVFNILAELIMNEADPDNINQAWDLFRCGTKIYDDLRDVLLTGTVRQKSHRTLVKIISRETTAYALSLISLISMRITEFTKNKRLRLLILESRLNANLSLRSEARNGNICLSDLMNHAAKLCKSLTKEQVLMKSLLGGIGLHGNFVSVLDLFGRSKNNEFHSVFVIQDKARSSFLMIGESSDGGGETEKKNVAHVEQLTNDSSKDSISEEIDRIRAIPWNNKPKLTLSKHYKLSSRHLKKSYITLEKHKKPPGKICTSLSPSPYTEEIFLASPLSEFDQTLT
eukprot:jgi/Psemu1/286693/fgenesh1_pg.149_\